MYGKDWEYANSRLQGTIVRIGEEPVFVHVVQRNCKALVAKLKDIYTDFEVDMNDLNVVPVPLGMCNFKNEVSYLQRIPMRRDWRQGLRRENFCSNNIPHHMVPPEVLGGVIEGVYPTLKEALENVKKGISTAFHRHWAITKTSHLMYKRDIVGVVDGDLFMLNRDYQYLAEALEEARK